ncbi:inositol monophosphatase family protein [Alteromonas sp. AMM-1]|uniref:inositol monophosphatase family protein n=1 Tax=Alteromonas sp. AMM-1 TaxID=3394233 RepID=UPI0039A57C36
MINELHIHQLADICRLASDVEILPRFRHLGEDQVEQKQNHNDLVTIADKAAETFIMAKLRALFPDALLIGEESVYADASALAMFNEAELSFVLDPIDGTWHYANGSVNFGVMLGIAHFGEMIGGIIFEPVTGDYLWAIKGKGAFDRIKGVDHPLRVGRHADLALSDTIGCYSFGVTKESERDKAVKAVMQMGRIMDYRCAAAEYRLLVTGAVSYTIFQNTLNLWDHGAGQLIATEAGACSKMLNGQPYEAQINGKLIVAESEARWEELAALFR